MLIKNHEIVWILASHHISTHLASILSLVLWLTLWLYLCLLFHWWFGRLLTLTTGLLHPPWILLFSSAFLLHYLFLWCWGLCLWCGAPLPNYEKHFLPLPDVVLIKFGRNGGRIRIQQRPVPGWSGKDKENIRRELAKDWENIEQQLRRNQV